MVVAVRLHKNELSPEASRQDSIRKNDGVMLFVDYHWKEENFLYSYYYLQADDFLRDAVDIIDRSLGSTS